MKPVQDGGGGSAVGGGNGQTGGRLFGEPGDEKDLFGRFEWGEDSFGEPGPVKTGNLAKMGEICS